MAKETFYFSHDYNTRTDMKIKRLLIKQGYLGYGVFWAIIEDLYNNENRIEKDYESISLDLRCDQEIVRSVVEDFGLFDFDDKNFSSKSVQKRLEERESKSSKAKDSIKKRWSKNAKNEENDTNVIRPEYDRNTINEENDTNVIRPEYDRNTIKEKKVKDIKVKDIYLKNIKKNVSTEFFRIGLKTFETKPSQWLQENKTIAIETLLISALKDVSGKLIFKNLDERYIGYDFKDENHVFNAFRSIGMALLKEKQGFQTNKTPQMASVAAPPVENLQDLNAWAAKKEAQRQQQQAN